MKRYNKHIKTGYKFLPLIPVNWDLKLGLSCFEENKKKNTELVEKLLLQFKYGTIVRKANQEIKKDDELTFAKYTVVEPNDIILNGLNLNYDFVSQRVGIVKEKGAITSAYLALRCRNLYNPFYANYMLKALDSQKIFHGMGSGVRLTLGYPEFSRIQFPVPPRNEQDQIVRYLDWQISKINHMIHGLQKQIKLLEERKVTLINNAVTKGIDPTVPVQNIPGCWMGNIPAHWKMIPSKRVFVEGKERRRDEDVSATASQKYGIISQEEYMRREGRRIVVANQGLDNWKHVDPGNFVISLRSFQGGIELCEITGCVTWHYVVLLPQEMVCTQYFKWLLKSKSYIKALQGTSEFIRDGQDLRYSNFVKVDLPLIPLEEQKAIADYINVEVAKIDNVLPSFQKEIDLLREYRTRLISDVVTGQIDVRDVVIPEYIPEDDTEIDVADTPDNTEEVAEDAE